MRKAAIILLMCLLMSAHVANAGIFDEWNYRMRITFTNDSRIGVLTNFPALIVLGTNITGFDYRDFARFNYDLRFADQTESSELCYEIEKWDTNGSSYIWVKVNSLEPGTNIYAYWGKWGSRIPPPPAYTTNGATWAGGYSGVWHLGDTLTPGKYPDSSAGKYDANNVGASSVTGKIGGALDFKTPNCVAIPVGAFSTISDQITISLWQYGDPAVQPRQGYIFNGVYNPPAKELSSHLPWSNGNVYWDAFGGNRINKAASASEYRGQWNHWVFLRNGGSQMMYLNGHSSMVD